MLQFTDFIDLCCMWGLYLDFSRSAVGHLCTMWQAYFSGAFASDVKCMYSSASGHTIDCSEFIWGICIHIVVLYQHKKLSAHVLHVAFEWHIYSLHIFGNNVWSTCSKFFGLVYAIMLGLYVDNGSSAVGHILAMSQAYLFRNIWQ